jgi:hypothetical protein
MERGNNDRAHAKGYKEPGMFRHCRLLFSVGMVVATTLCSRGWSSEFSPIGQGSSNLTSGKRAAKVVTVSRMSFGNFHDSIADQTATMNGTGGQDGHFPFRTGHIGRSHQHVKDVCKESRDAVTLWFCYIKGIGPAIWYMGP